MLTLSQAAQQVTASRTTIQRAIKNGKISAEKTEAGYQIDPAELFRAFEPVGARAPAHNKPMERYVPQSGLVGQDHFQPLIEAAVRDAEQTAEIVSLRKETARLESQLHDMKQEREGWKTEAGDWKDHARSGQKLLEDHSKQKSQGWIDKLLDRFQKTD